MEEVIAGHPVSVHLTLAKKVTFASQQNSVPVIRELALENTSSVPLSDLAVEITCEPAFLLPKTWRLDRLNPGDQVHLQDRDVSLSPGVLWELTEAVTGSIQLRVLAGDMEVGLIRESVELLARTEWGGADYMPEMIAAFVTPNDPAVDQILKTASGVLRSANLPTGLDGYQTGNPRRAAELAAAIWSAVAQLGLDYASPPASFERTGQKIRTPSHIIEGGLATCLDTTLLFAACLEQAGLHPIIVFTRGHAFVGCWLRDEQFSTVVVDDVTSLRKRLQLKEVIVFETTLAVHHPPAKFPVALKHARDALAESRDAEFQLAIDVQRARMQRIRPIPTGREPEPRHAAVSSSLTQRDPSPLDLDVLGDIPDEAQRQDAESVDAPSTRLDRWQRKLLDLSLRNRLLNFKPSKRAITLRCPDPGLLEDHLADGKKVHVRPSPRMMDEAQGRSAQIHQQRHGEDAEEAYALDALKRDEVIVDLAPDELERRLVELYRTARSNVQEGGANTLFLALGFLVWRKDEKDERRYRAPLILIPVSIERKSVRAGMRLVLHDDEPRVNPTLLQMLEQDFALKIPELAGPLPVDSSGLDVRGIWNAVTRAIRDQQGWEVAEDVVLSTFSFAKYLMWKDLVDRTDALKANPVVRHLIETPKEPYDSSLEFPEPRRLDHDYPPEKTFTPLPADSSQLSAIMAAAEGKDFVLVGPPGTGKSQTISNLIAQCLAAGRTVLFVSEKTAALDVVYRRLRDVGLGEFCLELHSSKARKLDVLDQLRRAWESRAALDADEWQREAARLGRVRDSLNAFVEHLHTRYPNGLTPYQAIGTVVAKCDVPRIKLAWPSPEAHDHDALDSLRDIAARIDVNSSQLGGIAGSALTAVKSAEWSPSWQSALVEAARAVLPALATLRTKLDAFVHRSGFGIAVKDREQLEAVEALARVLPDLYGKNFGFMLEPSAPTSLAELAAGISLLVKRQEEAAQLSCEFAEEALRGLDVDALRRRWHEARSAWWLRAWMLRRQVRKPLQAATAQNQAPDCENDLPRLEAIVQLDQELEAYAHLAQTTGGLWAGISTDHAALEGALKTAERLRGAVGALAQTPDEYMEVQAVMRRLLTDGNALLAADAVVGRAAGELRDAADAFRRKLENLIGLTGSSIDELAGRDAAGWLAAVETTCVELAAQETRLRTWCAWRRVRDEAVAKGLAPLVDAVEGGLVQSGAAAEAFEANYCRWWVDAVVDRDDVLRGFVPAEHERMIEEFARLDEKFVGLTRAYIRAKLCGQLPDKGEFTRSSEWGVLKRELEKKRRHMPLRQLVEEMPTALTKLTPCLLMSPLSIAQYLSAGQALFDVVVFDEASQIPVWDAVGAIARGRRAVIVGDPKQLPPTSFFDRAADEEDNDEDVESDLESILDECMGASLPVRHLNWHYRSRHESLIAFSNHRYYGGGLVTFPSPVTEDRAVSYHHVPDGVYEKGGARVNQQEAKALVADLVGRLKDRAFQQRGLTIGVVTFNSEQQRLIEDLLDEERRKDPSVERWFAEEALEPVMVKNLESVQGDERDIIYFSIAYGPDLAGRLSMNFGPLNRDGGERRLNVAITRARHELRVFATLRGEQIDLSRTQAIGVRDFKHFLEYAERGPRALAEATRLTGGDFESPFEMAVANALSQRGWQVHPQVGVSSFRVDLGVVHPDAPGRYLAGVECDGATYHRSATARDRDKLREAVLRGLGWDIVRVWSTDWWTDAATATDKLDRQLSALLDASRAVQTAVDGGVEVSADELAPGALDAPTVDAEVASGDDEQAEINREQRYARAGSAAPAVNGAAARVDLGDPISIGSYREFDLSDRAGVEPSRFYDDDYSSTLDSLIQAVIEAEGPIRDDMLVKRIARAHDLQRAGRLVRERVVGAAKRIAHVTREDVGEFFWPTGVEPDAWTTFRAPSSDADVRSVEDIPMEELRILARQVIERSRLDEEALREMAQRCGVRRLGPTLRQRLEAAYSREIEAVTVAEL